MFAALAKNSSAANIAMTDDKLLPTPRKLRGRFLAAAEQTGPEMLVFCKNWIFACVLDCEESAEQIRMASAALSLPVFDQIFKPRFSMPDVHFRRM